MEDKNKIISRKEQIKSSIIGFIVGDAIGVPVEFKSRNELKNHPVSTMEEYGTHYQPKGTWSDDSSMVLASINAIVNNHYSDSPEGIARSMAYEFVNWYDHAEYTPFGKVFDIGGTTLRAISEFKRNKDISNCGMKSESENGNGSLMRILPAVFYGLSKYKEEKELNDFIFMISSLTHAHAYSKISCLIYSKYIEFLLEYSDKYEAYLKLKEWFKEPVKSNPKYSFEDIKPFDRILKEDISKLKEKEIKSSGYVLDSLEATLWAILTTNNYKDAVLKAVNLGDDTDTIGALTGGLAGLIYGYDSIPSEWIDVLQKKEYILELVNKFADGFKDVKKGDKNNMKKEIATKDSWTTLPMSDKFEDMELDIHLNEEELEIVKRGHIPEVMEDHWFMYYENSKLYIHRSWTGFCCFIVDVPENGHITHAIATRDEIYRSRGIEDDKKTINDLIRNHIKYYNVELEPSFRLAGPEEVEQILLKKNKDDAMKIIDKVIEDDNDEFLNKQVPEIVEKIKDMPYSVETTIAKLINYDPVNIFVSPLMQGKILNAVKDNCKKNKICIEEIRGEERYTGLPYHIPFMKVEKTNSIDNDSKYGGKINMIKNNFILKVEHTPFHNAYGLISELKTPDPIVKEIPLVINKILDLGGISLKVIEVSDELIKLSLPSGQGVFCDYNLYKEHKEELITLKVNETKKIDRNVMDCMEYWKITFINQNDLNGNNNVNEISKLDFPKVKAEIREYYVDENGHENERTKTIEIPDIKIPSEKNESNINIEQPIIMFKLIADNKTYQLHFGFHDDKGWLDYSNSDDPQDLYYCNLSELMFKEFYEQITKLTSNWKNRYSGENKIRSKWMLKEIKGNKLNKNFEGENEYPDNWNEFIEFMIFYEKICKIYSKNNSEK